MSELIMKEDWEALIEVLSDAIKKLDGKQVEPVKLGILEFVSTAAMLGLQDLADVSKGFEGFLLQSVAPAWDTEAVATLSFSMGALVEKMQLQAYGPKFSAGLSEITLYLELYDSEEAGSDPPAQPELDAGVTVDDVAEEDIAAFALDEDELNSLFSDTHLLDDVPPLLPEAESASILFAEKAIDFETEEQSPPAPEPELSIPDEARGGIQTEVEPQPSDRSEEPSIRPNRDMGFVMDRVDWYKQILRNDPTSQAFVSLAEELCFRSRWREAVETCRKGLALHPYLTRGRVLMGWALWELGKADEAERMLTEVKSEMEANFVLYKILAEIAASRGDSKSAQSNMEIFQSLLPRGVEGLASRAVPKTFEDQPQSGAPSIVEFLAALLQKFEGRRSKTAAKTSIFSDTGRQALKYLLTAAIN